MTGWWGLEEVVVVVVCLLVEAERKRRRVGDFMEGDRVWGEDSRREMVDGMRW